MKLKVLLFFLICSILLTSCVKEEPVSCVLPSVNITGNSPVIVGGTINLSTPLVDDSAITYSWTGPNNFNSTLQNLVINNADAAAAGVYKLKVKKGICESAESSILIEVVPNPVSCTVGNNTMTFEGGLFDPVSFNYIYTSNYIAYSVNASGSDDLRLRFYDENTPSPGLYNIAADSYDPKVGEVGIYLLKSGYTLRANTGVVAVTMVNNKLTFAFCNVLFVNPDFPFVVKVSTKITLP